MHVAPDGPFGNNAGRSPFLTLWIRIISGLLNDIVTLMQGSTRGVTRSRPKRLKIVERTRAISN